MPADNAKLRELLLEVRGMIDVSNIRTSKKVLQKWGNMARKIDDTLDGK